MPGHMPGHDMPRLMGALLACPTCVHAALHPSSIHQHVQLVYEQDDAASCHAHLIQQRLTGGIGRTGAQDLSRGTGNGCISGHGVALHGMALRGIAMPSHASQPPTVRRSSNAPRYCVPATREPTSSAINARPLSPGGAAGETMSCAMPSTSAVLPTPGSPISTGLFLVRLRRTCLETWHSAELRQHAVLMERP